MEAIAIVAGALMCWRAPMPDLINRVELPVKVVEAQALPSGEAGAWVLTVSGRLAGHQWHVSQADLVACKQAKPDAGQAAPPAATVQAAGT